MKKIFVVTEGQSETNFVKRVVALYFADKCILIPNTVVTKVDHRKGKTLMCPYEKVALIEREIRESEKTREFDQCWIKKPFTPSTISKRKNTPAAWTECAIC